MHPNSYCQWARSWLVLTRLAALFYRTIGKQHVVALKSQLEDTELAFHE